MRSAVDILYYAAGGGLGHATRAAAILRQARRLGADSLAFVTTPRALPLEHEGIPYHRPAELSPESLRAEIQALIESSRPRIFVVDTFPLGITEELAGILPALPCRKMLVARRLGAQWAAWGPPAWAAFDRVLLAEAWDDAAVGARPCSPILLWNAEELWPREEARAALGVAADEPVVLGISSDEPDWTSDFFALLRKAWRRLRPAARLRLASPHLSAGDPLRVDHYPLVELFNGVDLIVGACGCNLFHEAQACGVPAIFLPRPRRFDDQYARARGCPTAATPEELEARLREMMPAHPRLEPSAYVNGAQTAAQEIRSMLK